MSPQRRAMVVVALLAAGLFWSRTCDRPPARPFIEAAAAERGPATSEPDLAPQPADEPTPDGSARDDFNTPRAERQPVPAAKWSTTSQRAAASGDGGPSTSPPQTDGGSEAPDRAPPARELPPRRAFDGFVPSEVQPLEVERTEATVADINACIEAGGCAPEHYGRGPRCTVGTELLDHPANCVTLAGARAYCRWIGARLPTAREWIQEATDGGQRRWPWGDDGVSCDRAVLRIGCPESRLWPVCSRPLGNSRTGVCDLIGNVAEWTRGVRDGHAQVMGDVISMLGVPFWVRPEEARPEVGVRCVRDTAASSSP